MASRRDFIKGTGVAIIGASVPAERAKAAAANELVSFSATKLAKMIRDRELRCRDVVQAHIDRIEHVNPVLNAVVYKNYDAALARAKVADDALDRGEIWGPLHGLPVTIKDLYWTKGIQTTGATIGRKTWVPDEDATAVRRWTEAGAVILGKTNSPELGLAYETNNDVFGRTNNPYDPKRTCGGSTGGEGAIIAACGSPLGLGGDAGGSIRVPAHFCGIAGIKPTWGRIPSGGALTGGPFAGVFFTQRGPLARTVEDLALSLPILAGPDGSDPYVFPVVWRDPRSVDISKLKVAFHVDNGIASPVTPVRETVQRAAKALANEVTTVDERRPPGVEESYDLYMSLIKEMRFTVLRRLEALGTENPSPLLRDLFRAVEAHARNRPEHPEQTMSRWHSFKQEMLSMWNDCDVVVCPVNALPAIEHGTSWEKLTSFSYTMTYNLTGFPAAVVRCGTSADGLPIGVQVVAPPWREDIALAVAGYLEANFGGWQPPPESLFS